MIEVKVQKGKIRVGEKFASLLSGSIHYWRLHPKSWDACLSAIKDMGLETIDTYINWEFHEISPGEYDFEGKTDPRRDLVGFLEKVRQAGFWLIVRPGPFIYTEWINMGVPTDVARYHRFHPEFTARATDYIREVCKVLHPYLATNGGNIVLLQSENETDPFGQCYEEQLGLGNKPGPFQEFLKSKYQGNIEKLNQVWDASYKSFAEARAIMEPALPEDEYLYRYFDFVEFRADYITKCVDHYTKEYRKYGIDIPITHNTYNIYHVQDFENLNKVVDLVGPDAYPANEFLDRTAASGEELGLRHLQEVFRYFRTFSETAYIPEYQCGTGHGLHYYTGILWPNHFVMQNLAAVQAGIQAWNWYMLVNRDNWMMSPINEWGRKQGEMFEVFAEMVKIYNDIDIPSLEKLSNTSVSFYQKHHWLKEEVDDPTLRAIFKAGIDYEFFNLNNEHFSKPILFYSGARWLPDEEQKKLLNYVTNGGHLVIFQTMPLYEDLHKKLNILGLSRPDRIPDEPFLDHLATETSIMLGDREIRTRAPFFVFDHDTPGTPITGTRVDTDTIMDTKFEENKYLRSLVIGHKYQIGYHEQRGKGSILVLGIRPTPEAITALHHYLEVPIPIYSQTQDIKPALFKGNGAYYAVLINVADRETYAPLDIDMGLLAKGTFQAKSLRNSPGIEVDDSQISTGRIYVHIPRKNGTIIEIKSI